MGMGQKNNSERVLNMLDITVIYYAMILGIGFGLIAGLVRP